MYERIQGNDVYNAGPNVPFSAQVTFNNVSLSNPNVSLLTGQTLVAPITVVDITGLAYSDYKSPASYQYSLGVQQELGRGSVVSVSYVGNQNRHQNGYRETNLPAPGQLAGLIQGTVAYNSVVPYAGFHSIRLSENATNSLSLFKSFTFSEARGSRLEFRAETFNAFNHTQFNGISTSFSASDFGRVTSTYNPRNLQLGMRLLF
jgi:hypothetical protein